jgi:dTDP-4-amino-4,6-dideoxygalactose transaminase
LRLQEGAAGGGRDALIAELKARGICTSVHFIPVHLHTYYRQKYGYQPEDFPVALDNYQRMLSLPLSPALTADEVSRVISAVRQLTTGGPNRLAA